MALLALSYFHHPLTRYPVFFKPTHQFESLPFYRFLSPSQFCFCHQADYRSGRWHRFDINVFWGSKLIGRLVGLPIWGSKLYMLSTNSVFRKFEASRSYLFDRLFFCESNSELKKLKAILPFQDLVYWKHLQKIFTRA